MTLSISDRIQAISLILSRYIDPNNMDDLVLADAGEYWDLSHPDFLHADLRLKDYDLLKTLGATIIKRNIISLSKEGYHASTERKE